jgi:hypothetical protein
MRKASSSVEHRTLDKLRGGVSTKTMLTASALAMARSSDLPPGHHGGPLHPLARMYAVSQLAGRLEGEQRFVPVLQHVALSNKTHSPPGNGTIQPAGICPDGFRWSRGDEGGFSRRGETG